METGQMTYFENTWIRRDGLELDRVDKGFT